MKAPKLNQIELFARKGGTRANAGRKAGESTSVIRIPTACLPTVTEILTAEQGAAAARVYAKTGKNQRNPYRTEAFESGWWNHGFRMEISRIEGVQS
ncbi:hypothetical protein [Thiothrix fructosivorans]|uniref:Uncharacterized protein n=1 Tax=Thiothrix fructosivorans TaxID=111770 RepID=A0A8B0SG95_9GAMM|nr:hypothetical protein [Thiothrix fructosivorans]MBO0615281.1 hypothetical protein [Thiothrix fructosivorans]QTX10064.1 hypothetical protein J1836_015890 [Thiothrix fructosivorans]